MRFVTYKEFHIHVLILSVQAERWDRYQYFHIKDPGIKANTMFHTPSKRPRKEKEKYDELVKSI